MIRHREDLLECDWVLPFTPAWALGSVDDLNKDNQVQKLLNG